MIKTVVFVALIVLACAVAEQKRYDNHRVLNVIAHTDEQFTAIRQLHQQVRDGVIDIWKSARTLGQASHIMVHGDYVDYIHAYLSELGMTVTIVVDDVQRMIDAESVSMADTLLFKSGDSAATIETNKYHTYDEIAAYLKAVSLQYVNITELTSIGKSHEGRDLWLLKIGKPASNKNGFWIDAGIHAREWIASATAVYIIDDLVSKYGNDPATTTLIDSIDFYILASFNPDGYEYSRTHERLWRKTRSGPRKGDFGQNCYGVDPNRNWDFHWAGAGTSNDACSEIYEGPVAFSEVECKAGSEYLTKMKSVLKAMITMHSYSEDILYPYGYATHTYPPDVTELHALGNLANDAVKKVRGTSYSVVNSADSLYPAAGASDDWSKHLGIKWVYTIELRPGPGDKDDDEHFGFVLPAKYIVRTADEIWAGIKVMATRVMTGPN